MEVCGSAVAGRLDARVQATDGRGALGHQADALSMRSFARFARRAVNNTTLALIPAPV
jgi:hypothetical protein